MKRIHTLVIALVLGAAAAAGLVAATRTVDVGAAEARPQLSESAIAARTARLDRLERSLEKALARRPPKLPKVPEVSPSSSQPVQSTSGEGGVVYVHSETSASPSSYQEDDQHEYENEDAGEVEHESDD
jgi:hypothetical protein